MAATLTFENTTETTSIDNLNSDEQDSLKVGEAMVEAQDELLAGKYKDAQELEKAYVELRKNLETKVLEIARKLGTPKIVKKWSQKKVTKMKKKLTSILHKMES